MHHQQLRPSPAEKQFCEHLIKRLTPPPPVHKRYMQKVDAFLLRFEGVNDLTRSGWGPLQRCYRVESTLLKRDYLVAKVDTDWYEARGGEQDASAAPALDLPAIFGKDVTPPIVLVPASKKQIRTKAFQPVLEHEFIHVNQILLKQNPCPQSFNSDPVRTMVSFIKAEFEAYFVEHCCFPRPLPPEMRRFDLYRLCVTTAFIQALENTVFLALSGYLSTGTLIRWLTELPQRLCEEFGRVQLAEKAADSCVHRFSAFLATAKSMVLASGMDPQRDALQVLDEYLQARQR